MHVIEVLGTGCSDCLKLGLAVARAAEQLGMRVDIRQVTDVRRIEAYGVLTPPGLAIDGMLASTGRVPPVTEIAGWLRAA
jgi:small redox-active disulfide protein 2